MSALSYAAQTKLDMKYCVVSLIISELVRMENMAGFRSIKKPVIL